MRNAGCPYGPYSTSRSRRFATPAYDETSRLPSALPFASTTWHPAPVFVRTHEVWRIGAMVRSKYVDSSGCFVVQPLGKKAAAAAKRAATPGKRKRLSTRKFYTLGRCQR